MSTLKDKNVLITGGASGIGKIMGRIALEKGCKRLVIWDINPKNLETTKNELNAPNISCYTVDVSNENEVLETYNKTKTECGVIDILINNAGIVVGKNFAEHTNTDIKRTMNINAIAPMMVTLPFLQDMIAQKDGHICNVASSAGLITTPRMSIYNASKWAVFGWSDSVRIEMQENKTGVHVTTIAPYYINTGMFDGVKSSIFPILKPERVAKQIIHAIEKNKYTKAMPWTVHFVRLCQGLLTTDAFDLIVGKGLGIYKAMDNFTGRK